MMESDRSFIRNIGNVSNHDPTLKKMKRFFIQIECLCDALKRDIHSCDISLTPISIIPSSPTTKFDELDQSLMYSQLLKEIILEIPDNDQEKKKEFVEFLRIHYANNDLQAKIIDQFEQQYDRSSFIW